MKYSFLTRRYYPCTIYVDPTGIAKNQNSNLKDELSKLFTHGAHGNKIMNIFIAAGQIKKSTRK